MISVLINVCSGRIEECKIYGQRWRSCEALRASPFARVWRSKVKEAPDGSRRTDQRVPVSVAFAWMALAETEETKGARADQWVPFSVVLVGKLWDSGKRPQRITGCHFRLTPIKTSAHKGRSVEVDWVKCVTVTSGRIRGWASSETFRG